MMRKSVCVLLCAALLGLALPVVTAQCDCGTDPDCVCNPAGSTVPDLTGNANDNTMTNYGVVASDMDGQAGDDTMTNNGSVGSPPGMPGAMLGGSGDDTLTNNGSVDIMRGHTDDDTLTNNGQVVTMHGNTGNDTLTNNGDAIMMFAGADNDTMTNNGGFVDLMVGDAGSDTIVNNGSVDVLDGAADRDTIINNGHMGGMLGGGDSDTLINNGDGIAMIGEFGNDTLVNNGRIHFMAGEAGSDTLINRGEVYDILGNIHDDTVILQDGASVAGIINGGRDFDSLQFDITVGAQYYEEVARQIMAANPNGGTITINGQTYTWINFEELVDLLQMAMFHDGRLNAFDFAATTVVYCEAQGIHLYTVGGEFAFRVEADAAQAAESGVVLGDALGVSLQGAGDGLATAFGPDGYSFTFEVRLCNNG
jgi:hypothetical protein